MINSTRDECYADPRESHYREVLINWDASALSLIQARGRSSGRWILGSLSRSIDDRFSVAGFADHAMFRPAGRGTGMLSTSTNELLLRPGRRS